MSQEHQITIYWLRLNSILYGSSTWSSGWLTNALNCDYKWMHLISRITNTKLYRIDLYEHKDTHKLYVNTVFLPHNRRYITHVLFKRNCFLLNDSNSFFPNIRASLKKTNLQEILEFKATSFGINGQKKLFTSPAENINIWIWAVVAWTCLKWTKEKAVSYNLNDFCCR